MVDPAARRSPRPAPRAGTVLAAILAVALIAVGLGSCSGDDSASGSPEGDCPVAPVSVVATIGPWGSIAEELAGDCAHVTTIVDGSRGDPHDVEPTPADRAAIEDADVVITNGLGYDAWADDALAAASSEPAVVVAGEVTGQETGANPHAWYDPAIVREAATAITQALQEHAGGAHVRVPLATVEIAPRFQTWEQSLAPYDAAIERVRTGAAGRPYAATEPVFDPMAAALGLLDVTPSGFSKSVSNGAEPSPGDVAAFDAVLSGGKAAVLIDNSQTDSAMARQLATRATGSSVPVVEVTETAPASATSFVAWQVAQLDALAAALGL